MHISSQNSTISNIFEKSIGIKSIGIKSIGIKSIGIKGIGIKSIGANRIKNLHNKYIYRLCIGFLIIF